MQLKHQLIHKMKTRNISHCLAHSNELKRPTKIVHDSSPILVDVDLFPLLIKNSITFLRFYFFHQCICY